MGTRHGFLVHIASMDSGQILIVQSLENCKLLFGTRFPFDCIFGDRVVNLVKWIGV